MSVDFTLPPLKKALAWLENINETVFDNRQKLSQEDYNLLLLELKCVKISIEEEMREQYRNSVYKAPFTPVTVGIDNKGNMVAIPHTWGDKKVVDTTCKMCDGTGYKDYAGYRIEQCECISEREGVK